MSRPPAAALLSDPAYPALKAFIIQATGLAYYHDKDIDLIARLERRMMVTNTCDVNGYRALLGDGNRGEVELDSLISELTIGETFFFRHREVFDALRDLILPERIAANKGIRQLRVWSAGCATGAEAYSVSIVLRRDLADQVAGWELTVLGTDINRDFLARARAAKYDEWTLRATPEEIRRECFIPQGGAWSLAAAFREGVFFQYHNLVTDPAPSLVNNLAAFDVILCRNVAIYFSQDIVRRLVSRFHECLVPGGWLLVGHAEPNIETFSAFRTVNLPGAVLYRREPLAESQSVVSEWKPPDLSRLEVRPPDVVGPVQPSRASCVPSMDPSLAKIRELADHGRWDEAATACSEAVASTPLSPGVHFYRGLVLEQIGDHAGAEQELRRTLYLDRQFVLAHYYLGLLVQKRGDYRQAIRSFRNTVHLLSRIPDTQTFLADDAISAGDLKRLAEMSLATLENT